MHGEADRGGELEALASSWVLPVEPDGWRVSFSSDPFSTIALDTGEPSPGQGSLLFPKIEFSIKADMRDGVFYKKGVRSFL